jgi:methionine-S-sulfoxide reductase
MGCFWGVERMFWTLPGVWVTAAGYAAGETPNPTYREVCSGQTGHNEVVLVTYDPAKVSYEDAAPTFWEGHDPTQGMRQGNDVGTQYRSGIYTFDADQRRAAEASRDVSSRAAARRRPRPVTTEIRAGARLLLRRGLPPAVPRQEPRRLLRRRRHRRHLPDRHRASAPDASAPLTGRRAGGPPLRPHHRRRSGGRRRAERGAGIAADAAGQHRAARPRRRQRDLGGRRPFRRVPDAAGLALLAQLHGAADFATGRSTTATGSPRSAPS